METATLEGSQIDVRASVLPYTLQTDLFFFLKHFVWDPVLNADIGRRAGSSHGLLRKYG